jgi:hypothetical protein
MTLKFQGHPQIIQEVDEHFIDQLFALYKQLTMENERILMRFFVHKRTLVALN